MPNVNGQLAIPVDPYERALWLDQEFEALLHRVPYALGMYGVERIEQTVFPPKPPILPIDPTCPTCGVETDDGTCERVAEGFRLSFQTCGHVVIVSEAELHARAA